jgi:surfeit locus 1 family protein
MTRLRIILWPLLATLVALGILAALGTWQLRRMVEKQSTLSALESAITAAPRLLGADSSDIGAIVVVPVNAREIPPSGIRELTRVTVSGTFIPTRSVPVRATLPTSAKGGIAGGIGFFWMTPLRLENGAIAFINRGFVPSGGDWKAVYARGQPGQG